jgi:acetolactate synthase-1/2/3 large subunit
VIALAARADAALVVGSKLGAWRTGHGRLPLPAALAQIDLDPAEIGRHYPVAVPVVAHAGPALDALLAALRNPPPRTRPARAAEIAAARAAIQDNARRRYGAPVALLDAVRSALPRDGVVVADMTMLGYASAECLPLYEPRTFIHAAELCSIGCGLPLALGAKVAAPARAVVALCGDGGFLLNAGELATAVQERLAVIAIVFNDAAYTAVKNDQRRRFGARYIATDLVPPDYVALARAFGAHGVRAADPTALHDALVAAQRHGGPTLIEVPL